MLELYRGGHQVALEIEGHNLRAIHPLGKVSIPNGLDETTLFDYLVEVAAVDPENLDVLGQLAQLCRTVEDLEQHRELVCSECDTASHTEQTRAPVIYLRFDVTIANEK